LDPARLLSAQAHRLWQSEDGLLQDTVSALLESKDGFLWIGTGAGLVRFDGATFEHYSRINVAGFTHNEVQCLAECRDGAIWMGTTEPGLYRFQQGQLRTFGLADGLPDSPIRCLFCGRDGTLWAAPAEGPLLRFDGTRFQAIASGAANLRIRALAQDAEGTTWVGTAGSGLWRVVEGRLALAALTSAEITALDVRKEGEVLVGTRSHGLFELTEGRLEPPAWAKELPSKTVRSLLVDREDSLWIGLEQVGLFRRTPAGHLEAAPFPSGPHWTPISLLEDSSGALWAGSEERGLQVLYPVPFQAVPGSGTNLEEPIRMVCQDNQGTVWCLGGNHALGRVRQGRIQWERPGIPPADFVTSIWPRRTGGLWLGTQSGDLYVAEQGQFRRIQWPEGPPSDAILSLYEDVQKVLWVATVQHGLLKLTPGAPPVHFPTVRGVQAMAGGGAGPLYLASRTQGLGVLDPDQVRWVGHAEGLGSSGALSLHLDDDGSLWVGTVDGLRRYRNGTLQRVRDRSGPLALAIHSILEDSARRMWLGTEQGVIQLPRAALLQNLEGGGPLAAMVLDHHDGMPSRETSGGAQPTAWLTQEGDLYFATSRGMTRLSSRASIPQGPPLRLHILKAESDETVLPEGLPIQVPPGTHRFEVYYTATSLIRADKVRFRYRLEGWEHAWNEVGDRRFSAYSNLPPGSYRFVLQAWRLDEDGPPQERALDIHIQPFLYQRPTFWALCLLGVAAFAWWLHRLRLQQLEARSAVLSERNRMAREIHDHLAQGFTGVLLQLEAAEAKLSRMAGDPAPVLTRIDHARNLAVASLQEARRSVMALRPRKPEGTDLLGALQVLADRLLAGTDIQVEMALIGKPKPLRERIEDELIRMAQELITNALRHGKARWVRVALQFEGRQVQLSIEDDGKGFDPSAAAAGYGMRSIRESVQQLHGQLDIDSSQGLGSRITITLPIRRWRS
jgi:signal transduction histidine kinase/ligand-binding sensor domain-containing protein